MFQRSSERRTDRVKKSCVRKVASLLAQPLSTRSRASSPALPEKILRLGHTPPGHVRLRIPPRRSCQLVPLQKLAPDPLSCCIGGCFPQATRRRPQKPPL